MSTLTPHTPESTFRIYTPTDAQRYLLGRGARGTYSASIYTTVFSHHSRTGGTFGLLLDVGCGPGNATRDMAFNFRQAIGVDGSEGMIEMARQEGGNAGEGPISFVVGEAEECDRLGVEEVEEGTVDLLTAAMAAHYFDMPRFWRTAAKIVKPGGTVALWTVASLFCHPEVPHAAEIQRILSTFERITLGPYEGSGVALSRLGYTTLPLPWTCNSPISAFPESMFTRLDWNREGFVEPGGSFLKGSRDATLQEFKDGMNTASAVSRWRNANPEKAGTAEDVVEEVVRELEGVVGKEGRLRTGGWTALLMFKRS